jgi:CBS domain-containing protein
MTARPTVADYMITEVVSFPPNLEINHAVAQLLQHRISGAPVLDHTGQLVGLLTKKDCFKAALNASYYQQWGGTVADYMSQELETMDADLDIVSAAEKFLGSPYRRFPVMRDGEFSGIISRSDLLRAFADQW